MWIEREVMPMLREALERDGLQSSLTLAGLERNKLLLNYSPIKRGMGYTAASVQLEFGGRATGEPHQRHAVVCDMAQAIPEIGFPTAQPLVLAAERTFWEKATAAHVFCRQGRLRGDRYSRHWYDLAAMAQSGHAHAAIADQALAQAVAEHKSMFFAEKDAAHQPIDYHAAVGGRIQIVPEGGALAALDKDYAAMLEDGLLSTHQPHFADILAACSDLQSLINR
jgi:hypothetical protein